MEQHDSRLQTINEDSKEFDESKINSPFLDQKFFGIKSFNKDISKNNHRESNNQHHQQQQQQQQPPRKLATTIFNNSNHIIENNTSTINSEPNREDQESNQNMSSINFPKSNESTNLITNIPEDLIRQIKEVHPHHYYLINFIQTIDEHWINEIQAMKQDYDEQVHLLSYCAWKFFFQIRELRQKQYYKESQEQQSSMPTLEEIQSIEQQVMLI